jgi:hypothetical protein
MDEVGSASGYLLAQISVKRLRAGLGRQGFQMLAIGLAGTPFRLVWLDMPL